MSTIRHSPLDRSSQKSPLHRRQFLQTAGSLPALAALGGWFGAGGIGVVQQWVEGQVLSLVGRWRNDEWSNRISQTAIGRTGRIGGSSRGDDVVDTQEWVVRYAPRFSVIEVHPCKIPGTSVSCPTTTTTTTTTIPPTTTVPETTSTT
jgi:hypothetical protein